VAMNADPTLGSRLASPAYDAVTETPPDTSLYVTGRLKLNPGPVTTAVHGLGASGTTNAGQVTVVTVGAFVIVMGAVAVTVLKPGTPAPHVTVRL
jgi:hypothetical protein